MCGWAALSAGLAPLVAHGIRACSFVGARCWHACLQVLEFTYNENAAAGYSDPPRRAFEQLLRRLLALPGPPALLLLHHYAWFMTHGDGLDRGLFYYPPEAQLTTFANVRGSLSCCIVWAAFRGALHAEACLSMPRRASPPTHPPSSHPRNHSMQCSTTTFQSCPCAPQSGASCRRGWEGFRVRPCRCSAWHPAAALPCVPRALQRSPPPCMPSHFPHMPSRPLLLVWCPHRRTEWFRSTWGLQTRWLPPQGTTATSITPTPGCTPATAGTRPWPRRSQGPCSGRWTRLRRQRRRRGRQGRRQTAGRQVEAAG